MILYLTSKGSKFALVNTPTQKGITTPFGTVKRLLKDKTKTKKRGFTPSREIPPIVA